MPTLTHIGADHIRREYEFCDYQTPDAQKYRMRKAYWTTLDPWENQWYRVEDERQYVKLSYHNDQDTLGYGRGLMEAIYFYYKCKTNLLQQMLQGVERFAVPWIAVALDASAAAGQSTGTGFDSPEALQEAYKDELNKMRSGNIFVYDAKHKIHTIDFSGEAARGILNLIEYFDDRLVQLILGSSLPSGGSEGGGSYALAAVQAGSTSALIRYDREIVEESLRDLRWALWTFNQKHWVDLKDPRGNILVNFTPPYLRIGREQVDDSEKNVRVMRMLLDAGVEVMKKDWYRAANLQQPDEGDDVVRPLGAPGSPGGLMTNPMTGQPTQTEPMAPADGVSMREDAAQGQAFLERCRDWLGKAKDGLIQPVGGASWVGSVRRDPAYLNRHLAALQAAG